MLTVAEGLTPALRGAALGISEALRMTRRPLEQLVRVSGPSARRPLCKGNWLRCGKVGGGTAKDRTVNGA